MGMADGAVMFQTSPQEDREAFSSLPVAGNCPWR